MIDQNPDDQALRNSMVYHSSEGMFAFRENDWVLVKGKGSGGFLEKPDTTDSQASYQLYHLQQDSSQQHNLYDEQPEKAAALLTSLEEIVGGR